MDNVETVRRAISDAGGVGKVAAHFNIARTSVYDWIRSAAVPVTRAVEMEIRFGVARARLRPDDWANIWPELKEVNHA